MKIKLSQVFLIVLFVGVSAQTRLYPGLIEYKNGKIDTLKMEIPSHPKEKSIWIQKNDEKAVLTPSDSIKQIYVKIKKNKYLFEYAATQYYKKRKKKVVDRKSKSWLILDYSTKKINVYSRAHKYAIDNRGKITSYSAYGTANGNFGITFFYKKKGDDNPLEVFDYDPDIVDDIDQYIAAVTYYLGDCEQVIHYINSEDFLWNHLYKTAVLYNQCK